MKRITTFMICLFVSLLMGNGYAKTATFDFKDPKNVNAVSITVDSTIEPIVGFATPTAGTLTFDAQDNKIISGKLSIPTSGITLSNGMMTKVLHSDTWLNAEKHPDIVFEYLQTISMGAVTENSHTMVVQGNMTIAGVTKMISAPVTLTLLPGKVKERNRSGEGDLMILRSKINLSRKDFNINPGTPETFVGPTISLVINLAGAQQP